MSLSNRAEIIGGQITVSDGGSKGIDLNAYDSKGVVTFADDAKITITGEDVVGIDVRRGGLLAKQAAGPAIWSLDLQVNGVGPDANATGIRFSGEAVEDPSVLGSGRREINHTQIVVNNVAGADTTGILVDDITEDSRIDIADTTITVAGNTVAGSTSGIKVVGVNEGIEVGLDNVTLTVTGAGASGVLLEAETSSAEIVGGTINVTGSGAKGIQLDSATANLRNNVKISVNTGADGESGGSGIYATGASTLKIANSQIDVGLAGKLQSTGIDLKDLSGAPATLDTVAIVVNSNGSRGIRADNSAFTISDHVTVNMYGSNSEGLDLKNNAIATISNTFVNMHQQQSSAVKASGKSVATINVGALSGKGTGSRGVHALDESTVNLSGTEITIRGDSSYGVQAHDDGTSISLDNVKMDVEGNNVYGLHSNNKVTASIRNGTTIKVTSDQSAYGIDSNNGATTELDNVTLDIDGKRQAYGVTVFNASELNTLNGTSITAKSADSTARGVIADSNAKVTLVDTMIDVEGRIAVAVAASTNSELTVSGGNIKVKSLSGSEAIGGSTSDSTVSLEGATVLAEGIKSIGWQSKNDAQFRMEGSTIDATSDENSIALSLDGSQGVQILGGSTLKAQGLGNNREVIALQAFNQTSASVQGSQLIGTGTDGGTEVLGALIRSGSVLALGAGTRVDVNAGPGVGIGVNAEGADSQILIANSIIEVKGEGAGGVGAVDGAVGAITASQVTVEGTDRALGLAALDGVLQVEGSAVQVTSDNEAIGARLKDGEIILESTRIGAMGSRAIAVQMQGSSGLLTTSGQTQLASSHEGVWLESSTGQLQAKLTDTELMTDGATFVSTLSGDAVHRIDAGAGVVTTANDGTLLRVERTAGNPTGRVELNIADGAVLAGAIQDGATSLTDLTANGGTHLSLSNADYSGSVQNVRSVNLANAARIGGGAVATPNTVLEDIHVGSDATLAGNWNIGGTLHASNGRIAPGNSIGVTTANAINWGPGTIFEVEVNAAGESDRVDVTGAAAADISQTELQVMQEDGTGGYRLDHDYTILTAAGGINGQFTDASWQGSELIKISPVYGANQIGMSLSVDEQALDAADLTRNQRAASEGALSVAGINLAADAAFLSNNPAASFDLLSGEIHPSTRAGLMNSSALLSNAILGRLRDRSASQPGSDAAALEATYPLWVSYTHNQQTAKGDSNTAKRKHKIDGFALGGDADVGAGWKVGGAFSYANSDIKLNERKSSSDIDSYSLAVYAGNSWEKGSGALNLMVGLGYTWHDISTRRHVELGGSQALKTGYDARTMQMFGELGYAMPVGERSTVEPYLGVTWLQHRTDGFTENGGPAALKGASGTDDVTFSTLGLRAATTVEAGKTALNLRAGLGWRHAFGDHQPSTRLSFIQGGGSAFNVVGAPIARNTAVFDLGAEVQVGRHTSIGLGYEGQAGSGFTEHAGSLYLKTRF